MFQRIFNARANAPGNTLYFAHYGVKRPERSCCTVLLCACLIAACGSDNSTDSATAPDENVDTETPAIPPTPVTPQIPDIPPVPGTPQNPDIPSIPAPPVIPPAPGPTDGAQPSPSLTTPPSPASEPQSESRNPEKHNNLETD